MISLSRHIYIYILKRLLILYRSNCQLRNTLHKARTLCDKWRPQNMRVNNADPLDSPGNHGRLSRWFSIRRGSTQQYDVDSCDTISLTSPIKTPQMPQLCEVIIQKLFRYIYSFYKELFYILIIKIINIFNFYIISFVLKIFLII